MAAQRFGTLIHAGSFSRSDKRPPPGSVFQQLFISVFHRRHGPKLWCLYPLF